MQMDYAGQSHNHKPGPAHDANTSALTRPRCPSTTIHLACVCGGGGL